jgi:hypothetical protein
MLASRASRCLPVISVWILAATDVHGQSSPPASPEPGTTLVNARRIPELAQSAPVAVTVLSTERIHNYNVNSLEQVAAITPGLVITRGDSGSSVVGDDTGQLADQFALFAPARSVTLQLTYNY